MATSKEELLDHGKSHYDRFKLFKYHCKKCSFKSMGVERIRMHLTSSTRCLWFVSAIQFNVQLTLRNTVICEECPFMASSKEEQLDQGKSHYDGFKLFEYHCKKCSLKINGSQMYKDSFDLLNYIFVICECYSI